MADYGAYNASLDTTSMGAQHRKARPRLPTAEVRTRRAAQGGFTLGARAGEAPHREPPQRGVGTRGIAPRGCFRVARNVRSQKDAGQKGNVGRRVWAGATRSTDLCRGIAGV